MRPLQEEYAELESLYRRAPIGLALLDRELRYVRINDRLAAINGRPAQDHIGRTFIEMVPEMAALQPLIVRVLETGEPVVELEVQGETHADPGVPHVWHASYYPVGGPDGTITGVSAFVQDVTARTGAERALRDSNDRLQAILDSLFVFVGVLSPQGTVLTANRAPLEVIGLSAADVIGRDVGEIYSIAYSASVQQRFREAVRAASGGAVVRFDDRVLTKDGAIWLDVMISPVRDGDGHVVELVASATDITDRKHLSRRLLEVQETERRALAHELHDEIGQALTAARLSLQTIGRAPDSPSESVNDAAAIVERAIAQVRSLSLALRPPLLDDFGLVAALRWILDEQARRAGLAATFIAGAVPRLDPALEVACFRIAQEALTNVVRHAQARRVVLEVVVEEGTMRLRIGDDGQGFDVAAARGRAAAGASLGLMGMAERAALAGGQIEWHSSTAGTDVRASFTVQAQGSA